MLSSLSDSIYKQYGVFIKSWLNYCNTHGYDYFSVSVTVVIHLPYHNIRERGKIRYY